LSLEGLLKDILNKLDNLDKRMSKLEGSGELSEDSKPQYHSLTAQVESNKARQEEDRRNKVAPLLDKASDALLEEMRIYPPKRKFER